MVEVSRKASAPRQLRMAPQARRHNELRRSVLRTAPAAASLTGSNPWTALALPVLVALHWSVAYWVSGGNALLCFLAAFFIGQVIIHSGGALLHETAHRLIFHGSGRKLAFDLGLEVLLGSFGKQLTYQYEHVTSHHTQLGNYERDYEHEDFCSFNARRSLRAEKPELQRALTMLTLFLHLMPFGFILSDAVMPKLYRRFAGIEVKDRLRDIGARKAPKELRMAFIAVSLLVNAFLLWAFGFYGWLYHNWSLSLFLGKFGVTNLGQSLSEHEGDDEENPTYSDYRAINLILFNTGYHNEHHTFPNVAWNRLPALRRLAPWAFDRENPLNYVQLWWRHVRDDFSPSRRNPLMHEDAGGRCPEAKAP